MYPNIVPNININGTILSIHLNNFFCHENLYIDFSIQNNRNVFSIMGDNGSGKSTILTALVIGLGGRAASTFRGKNLQSFIKRRKTTATIEIKIKNTNPHAYRHDIYGDSITVVRTINASGGSYKILSASGQLISTKASDIKNIAMALDIQIENPISVLNQDDARSFHGVNAKDKYSAFRRATNFAQTEQCYNRAQENCKNADSILVRKKEAFQDLSKIYRQLKMEYDQMKTQEEIENEKRELLNELKWFDVKELEHEVKNRNGECERFRATYKKLTEKLQRIEEDYANNEDTLKSLSRRASVPSERRRELERSLREAEAEAERAAEQWRRQRGSRDQLRARLQRERRQAAELLGSIRNIESGQDDAVDRLEAKERARAAVEETRARQDTAAHEEEQARDQAARAAALAEGAAVDMEAAHKQLAERKRELRELQQHATHSLGVFGAPMVELCRLVEGAVREGRFSAPPKGPVGNYLKVRSKEWTSALEHIIGGHMTQFCVNNAEDSRRLFEIMSQCRFPAGRKPGVTCSAFQPRLHDVSARRVSAREGTCAFDALEVSDTVVANFLIDNLELETVLLVCDHDVAVRLSSSVNKVPANCSKVVTKDCTDYMPAPRYRIYGGVERPPRYLATSTEDRTRQMEEKIVELEASIALKTSEATHKAREKETAERNLRRASKALQALQSTMREQARAAKDADEALQQYSTPHLAVLKTEYDCCKDNETKLEKEILELTDNEQTLEEEKKKADVRVDELKKQLKGVNGECLSLQEETAQRQLKLEQSAADKRSHSRHLSEEGDRLKRAEDALEEARTALADGKEGLGPRPRSTRERAEVQGQLRLLARQENAAPAPAARDALRARLRDITARRDLVSTELRAIDHLVDKIAKLTKKHLEICYTLQTIIGRHVELTFTNILRLRNYVGHIELDHADGELEVFIDKKNTRMLSGGERSYSTVALFMAMWECVEVPFYFMDEFDVFMDDVNRTTIWQLLVDFASERKGRQFVFLTQKSLPLDEKAIVVRRSHTQTYAQAHTHTRTWINNSHGNSHTHTNPRIHTRSLASTHERSHTYTNTRIHIRTLTYTHKPSHTHKNTRIHTRTLPYIHNHSHTYTITRIHTQTLAYIYEHLHTYTNTRIHACTLTLPFKFLTNIFIAPFP